MTQRWGKAGVRLTPQQVQSNDFHGAARRAVREQELAIAERHARTKWAAGMMVPHYITLALDSYGLYGPEVDAACGAAEPEVDMWEAGVLYPTWEQVTALARLTNKTTAWFMRPPGGISMGQTSMRFHVHDAGIEPDPVWRFTPDAIAAMKARLEATA